MEFSIQHVRELLSEKSSHSFKIGTKYLIRTVTMYYTGRIKEITDSDIVLSDAAWVSDTGKYSDALAKGELSEVEAYPDDVVVMRGVIIDFTEWKHALPRTTK